MASYDTHQSESHRGGLRPCIKVEASDNDILAGYLAQSCHGNEFLITLNTMLLWGIMAGQQSLIV